jgi:sugar-specific transcriptional regulator TrmB
VGFKLSGNIVAESIPILKRNLGITNTEAKAILPVFIGGNMTAGGVSVASGEPLGKVEKALVRLTKKGLITRLDGIVPVYRLAPTIFTLEGALSSIRENLQTNSDKFQSSFEGHLAGVDESIDAVIDSYKNTMDDGKVAFQSYETEMLAKVQSQVDVITSIATETLAEFTQSIENSMNTFDISLDDGLGARLKALQLELDKSQKQLNRTATSVSGSFKKWLTSERKASNQAIKTLGSELLSLTQALREAVTQSLAMSKATLAAAIDALKEEVLTKSTAASDDSMSSIGAATIALDDTISIMDAKLKAAYMAAEETLKEISDKNRTQIAEESEAVRSRIEEALGFSDSANDAIGAWKEEVATFSDVSMQSLKFQIDRVSVTESDYLDNVKAAVTGNIEKTQTHFAKEYETLKEMSIEGITQFEAHLNNCRTSTLGLLKKQMKAQGKGIESANLQIHAGINRWTKSATKNVDTKLTKIVTDVNTILDTEVTEIDALVDVINSRLKSAFKTVMSASSTKHESALTSVKKATHDFEADFSQRLSEIGAGYVSTAKSQIEDAESLYTNLNERLDKRLVKGVSALTSHANKVQREIDKALEGQVERIDQHAQGIREELHVHLDDLTSQFENLVKGLEATFNGFLASQTTEARDLISSAHTEFKGLLKAEMSSLQEDSQLLQQEFSSELGGRVDELVGAAAQIQKSLDELSVDKRTEISTSMADTLSRIEDAVRSTEDALKEIETGTIRQFGENLVQVSKEFTTTVTGARDSIAERIATVKEATHDSITKSSNEIRSNIDTYTESQRDAADQLIAGTSKKMDTLASKLLKASNANVKEFQDSLSEKETARLASARAIREEALGAIEDRRSEVALVFTAASETIETSAGNLSSSLDQLAVKLEGEMSLLNDKLASAADKTAVKVLERGEKNIKKFEETNRGFIKKSQADLKNQSAGFSEDVMGVLTKAGETLAELPTKLAGVVEHSAASTNKQIVQHSNEVGKSLEGNITDFVEASKSISSTSKTLIDRVVTEATKNLETALEDAKKGALVSNQYAARKLESIGIELKTHVGSESSRLTERVQSDTTAKNTEITGAAAKAMNDATEGLSVLRQTRNDAFNSLSEHADKLLRQWSTEQKKDLGTLKSEIEVAVGDFSELAEKTIETIDVVKGTGAELLTISSDNTWYVTGKEEICAHMIDMVSRAEKSVVLSVPDLECLNLKKLARTKSPRRKILVIPETEELDTTLKALEGWRIWQTSSPTTLAIIDKSEVLVGGSESSDVGLALVSRAGSYLRFYSDYLGPVLTKWRKSAKA